MPLRLRLAVLFAAGAALFVLGGGFLLTHALSVGMHDSVESTLQARAATLTTTLAAHPTTGPPPSGVPTAGATGRAERVQDAQALRQVLTARGAVLDHAGRGSGRPLLTPAELTAARQGPLYLQRPAYPGGHRFLLLAQPLRPGTGPVLVVGSSLALVDQSLDRVEVALGIGGALAVALAGVGAWFLARAALAPVEALRRQADDISERDRDAELGVPATRDEVAALARTFNRLLARLQGALSRQRGFVASAGHELRTPLAILRAELELANREGRSREELAAAVGSAADETERLVRLAEDLLLLARGDEAAPVVRPVTLDLVPAVAKSVEAHTDRARHQEVTLALATPAHAVLPADETRVRQMVDNLIDNALRFAPTGSTIDVDVTVQDTVARIEVADRGPGFPPEFLPHAFERFRRPDHDRNRGHGGGGLGLSIVQSLAQGHRGWAEAANRARGGAVVAISLPLDPAANQPARSVDHRRARRHRGLGTR